ncbi:MAG: energy-coupling factor transporter transmembrane component T [Chloroflexota bacterium]
MPHALAWLAWAVYQAVAETAASGGSAAPVQGWRGLLRLGLWVWALTIPFNMLMLHQGRLVLVTLPPQWPLVGGPITVEALLQGLVAGFALWVLLLIFAALNMAVDVSQLLRLMPPFLYQAGVVVSIALTLVPNMLTSAQEIREAQQVRGHRFRGWRDLLPLFVPLLTTAFERAIQLAESIESRGFGREVTQSTPREWARNQLLILAGLGLALAGLVARAYGTGRLPLGAILLGGAAVLLIYAFQSIGRHVQRSRYRRARWTRADGVMTLLSGIAAALPLAVRAGDKLALMYYPFPPYPLAPEFDARIGVALALLATPALILMARWGAQPIQPADPPPHSWQPPARI